MFHCFNLSIVQFFIFILFRFVKFFYFSRSFTLFIVACFAFWGRGSIFSSSDFFIFSFLSFSHFSFFHIERCFFFLLFFLFSSTRFVSLFTFCFLGSSLSGLPLRAVSKNRVSTNKKSPKSNKCFAQFSLGFGLAFPLSSSLLSSLSWSVHYSVPSWRK